MKKIVSLIIVFTLCLSTLTYADYNWNNIRTDRTRSSVTDMFNLFMYTQPYIVGRTNDGVVIVRDEGVEVIPFDEFNMFIYGNFNAQNVVGNDTRAVDEERPSEPDIKDLKPAIHIEPNSHHINHDLPD